MKRISNNQKRRGISIIWVVLTFMVMFAIGGLMLDWAHVYLVGHQLHNAADAAALAGSRWVPDPNSSPAGYTARQKALEYANANYAAKLSVNLNPNGDTTTVVNIDMSLSASSLLPLFNDGDIYIGSYIDDSRLFIKNDPYPDAMLVVTRKLTGQANDPLPLLFAPIVTSFYGGTKVEKAGIQKYAVAKIKNPYGAGVLALGECCGCYGILFDGSGTEEDLIILGGGSLYVNSCYVDVSGKNGAIDQSGNAPIVLNLDRIYTVGSIDEKLNIAEDTDAHDYNDSVEPEPDPFADVPDADYSTTPDLGTIAASGTYSPGYYSGGIQITSGITITLLPGNYYLDSIGQAASMGVNGGLITGEGVTLHIIGDADKGVDVQGGGSEPVNIDISAPTSGPYAGIAIFQKRNPDYNCAVSCSNVPISEFNGHGDVDIDGAIYMPHNKLLLGGTGDILVTRTVADRFIIKGTGQKLVDYKGEPKIADRSYLVE